MAIQGKKQAEETQPRLSEELEKMPYEPLLPIEKKLILWSVLLGVFLLGALVLLNQALFHST